MTNPVDGLTFALEGAQAEIEALRAELQQVKDELERRTRAMYEAHDADHAELQQVKDALRTTKDEATRGVDLTGCRFCRQNEVIARAALEGTDQ